MIRGEKRGGDRDPEGDDDRGSRRFQAHHAHLALPAPHRVRQPAPRLAEGEVAQDDDVDEAAKELCAVDDLSFEIGPLLEVKYPGVFVFTQRSFCVTT